ncbi:MAG: double zinc ribbon domain-containing protein [Anaerolineales bacterium]
MFPPECGGCGKPGTRLCSECEQRSPQVDIDTCAVCGKPMHTGSRTCPRLKWLDEAFAWGLYRDPLGKTIRRLKYSRDIAVGDSLSRLLFAVYKKRTLLPDLVAPVPLAQNRQQSRGYN